MMMDYFELLTDVPDKELKQFREELTAQSVNPMELKKRLAREIVTQFHSQDAAHEAEVYFERVVQRREIPEEIPVREIHIETLVARALKREGFEVVRQPRISGGVQPDIVAKRGDKIFVVEIKMVRTGDLLRTAGLVNSYAEARRMIAQGAVEINGKKVASDKVVADEIDGSVIKVGKRRFVRIINADKKTEA
jgi:tyrosyl-tRNA synthetase